MTATGVLTGVSLTLFLGGHRELKVVEYLDVRGKHQALLLSVNPGRLGLSLDLGEGELGKEGGVELGGHFRGFDKGVAEGQRETDKVMSRQFEIRPIFADPVVLLEGVQPHRCPRSHRIVPQVLNQINELIPVFPTFTGTLKLREDLQCGIITLKIERVVPSWQCDIRRC
jgi:hypothetical protein